MAVNNEIGVVQPLAEIGKLCRERKVFFHTDAAQVGGWGRGRVGGRWDGMGWDGQRWGMEWRGLWMNHLRQKGASCPLLLNPFSRFPHTLPPHTAPP